MCRSTFNIARMARMWRVKPLTAGASGGAREAGPSTTQRWRRRHLRLPSRPDRGRVDRNPQIIRARYGSRNLAILAEGRVGRAPLHGTFTSTGKPSKSNKRRGMAGLSKPAGPADSSFIFGRNPRQGLSPLLRDEYVPHFFWRRAVIRLQPINRRCGVTRE